MQLLLDQGYRVLCMDLHQNLYLGYWIRSRYVYQWDLIFRLQLHYRFQAEYSCIPITHQHQDPLTAMVTVQCSGNKTHLIHINRLTYQKEYNTNSYIGKDNAHPDFIGQWVQKGEDSWFGFLRLFDHDGYSQRHEGFGEIDHLFTNQSDRQGSNCNIGFLMERQRQSESV